MESAQLRIADCIVVIGYFLLLVALNYNTGCAMVQRFYSVRDEKEARKVGYLAAALNILGPPRC